MAVSRRDLVTYGAAGAITSLVVGAAGSDTAQGQTESAAIPGQVATDRPPDVRGGLDVLRGYDMRNDLNPRRLTMARSGMGRGAVSLTSTRFSMRPLSANTILFASTPCRSGLITTIPIGLSNGLTRTNLTCHGSGIRGSADPPDHGSSTSCRNCYAESHSITRSVRGGSRQGYPPARARGLLTCCAILQI